MKGNSALSRNAPDLHREGCGHRVRHDHQLHHEERYRPGAGPQDCPGEQGLANGDLSPGDAGRASWYSAQLHQRNISGVPQQRCDEASIDGFGEGRGMKIYIAGPMTGYENYNRPMFNAVAQQMLSGGHVALNPATLPDGLSQREYMDICLAMLRCADAIHMLHGWQESDGAVAEHAMAKKLGIKISYQFEGAAA